MSGPPKKLRMEEGKAETTTTMAVAAGTAAGAVA